MLAFILRRLIQAVMVMVTVAFIAFMLFQYVGDPVVFLLGQDATPEQIRSLRADLGLDKPFFVQFWHFLVNAAQGEFGLSLRQGAKVSRLMAERFPATLELALVAAALALLVGVPMGVYAALKRGTFISQAFMTLSLLGVSLPTFLIGILLILVFAVVLGWFPSFGRGEVVHIGWWTSGLLTASVICASARLLPASLGRSSTSKRAALAGLMRATICVPPISTVTPAKPARTAPSWLTRIERLSGTSA